jgi:hypothetical protein
MDNQIQLRTVAHLSFASHTRIPVTLNRPHSSHIQYHGCSSIGGLPCPQRNARRPEWETRYGADVMETRGNGN